MRQAFETIEQLARSLTDGGFRAILEDGPADAAQKQCITGQQGLAELERETPWRMTRRVDPTPTVHPVVN